MRLDLIKSDKLKKLIALYVVFTIGLMFRGYLLNTFYYFEFKQEPLFFTEYFFSHIFLTMWGGIILGLINIGLLWIIGYKLYNFQLGLLMSLLYAISPWTAYVDIFGGDNTYVLTWLLMMFLSLILFKEDKKRSIYLLILSICGLLLSSILSILILVTVMITLYISDFLHNKDFLKVIKISSILAICFVGVLLINVEASKNIFHNNSEFFDDIGLLNAVNSLRGETSINNLSLAGKMVENKYLYNIEEFIYRIGMNFSPALFFTPQHKLFDFSFSPPIYLGFIIPCILGIGIVLEKRKYVIASILLLIGLAIPSVINKNSPDLSKLIIVAPLIFFCISLGCVKMINNSKNSLYKWLLITTITLVLIQIIVTLGDLSLREQVRFEMFYNQFS